MVETKDLRIRTYEELVWDKVVKLNQAKEAGDDYFFDELLDEIEMIFKLVPDIERRYTESKNNLINLVSANLNELDKTISIIEDDITRELLTNQKKALIKWEYRSDMLESILNIINEFQMIPFANPYLSESEEVVEDVVEEEVDKELERIEQPAKAVDVPQRPQNPEPQRPTQEGYPNIGKKIRIKRPENV